MNLEDFFNRSNIIDLSFFNFRNAITAAFYADKDLRILRVNENFRSFFPILGNVSNAYFPHVLEQLGIEDEVIKAFSSTLEKDAQVLIPKILINQDGKERIFSLLATYTQDDSFTYLNGVQGQFVDRTEEFELRAERERLLEEKIKDRELIEEKTKQLEDLANRLAKYLSPQIYASIFSDTSGESRALARKNLTIFFSDIEGFTEITDGMEPEKIAFLVNTYLSEMSNIALEYGGTIDKFIGDAMLIFFGDPETEGEAEDAIKCAKMAIRMRERISELKSTWQSRGISKPLKVRMGISTGYCTVGNFGSEQRLEYTVLGSPVNMAARLQSVTAADTILVSDATHSLTQDALNFEGAGEITPRGFARPVETFRLLSAKSDNDKVTTPIIHTGEHVHVSIIDPSRIREAIIELKAIQEKFEKIPS